MTAVSLTCRHCIKCHSEIPIALKYNTVTLEFPFPIPWEIGFWEEQGKERGGGISGVEY